MDQPPRQDERLSLGTAGIEFAVMVGALTGGGYWLDGYTGMLPVWTLVGLAVGFATALYRLIRQVKPSRRQPSEKTKDGKTK